MSTLGFDSRASDEALVLDTQPLKITTNARNLCLPPADNDGGSVLGSVEDREAMPSELTLSFHIRGVDYTVSLSRAEGAVGPNYKELHVDGRSFVEDSHHSHEAGLGDATHTRAPPRMDCFYHGHVDGLPGSAAAVAACRNDKVMGSVFLASDTIEIQSDGLGGHVGFFLSDVDASEFGTCGVSTGSASAVGDEHHHHHHNDAYDGGGDGHEEGHRAHAADVLHGMRPSGGGGSGAATKAGRGLGASECANNPNKFVEILAVSDESFYALKGDDTENYIAQVFNSMSSFYATLQDSGSFACNVQLRLVGQIVFRYGRPDSISQRPCNTASPFKDFDYIGGSNDCCNYQGLGNCEAGTTVCVSAFNCEGGTYRTVPGCYEWGGASSTWQGTPGNSNYKKKVTYTQQGSCSPRSISASEIDESAMLGDFTGWVEANRAALVATFGGAVDNAMLFSGKDFLGSTIGLAGISAMCTSDRSGSIVQATSLSLTHIAATAAHEMGHNFGMQHDASGSSFMMAPSVAAVPATAFSSASKGCVNSLLVAATHNVFGPTCCKRLLPDARHGT